MSRLSRPQKRKPPFLFYPQLHHLPKYYFIIMESNCQPLILFVHMAINIYVESKNLSLSWLKYLCAVEKSVHCLPISVPSWKTQSTVQPTSVNTAVKKGLPARTLCGVLHSNLASTSCDPTHTPAGSKFGASSPSHSCASRVRAWGGIKCAAVCEAGDILKRSLCQLT